jgi:hypothetical protein
MKIPAIAITVLMLAACSTNPPARYTKDNAGREEFYEMVYQCKTRTVHTVTSEIRDAYGNVTPEKRAVDCDKFNACMATKGFRKLPNGDFAVRDEDIACKQ